MDFSTLKKSRPVRNIEETLDEQVPLLNRVATFEGWAALFLAIAGWLYANLPVGPMVGMPVEQFIRDISPLFLAVPGIGFGLAGIRLGNPPARGAGALALALLLLLVAFVMSIVKVI